MSSAIVTMMLGRFAARPVSPPVEQAHGNVEAAAPMRNKSRRLNEEPNCLIGHIIPSGRVSGANSGQAGAGPRASGRNRCEFVLI